MLKNYLKTQNIMPSPPKADEESLFSANHRPLPFALIMPISPYQVNKLFAAEAILQIVARHCGLPKTTKDALTPLRSRILNTVPPASFFQRRGTLKQGLFLYNVLPAKALRLPFYRKHCLSMLRLFTSAPELACFAAALIIDTV